MTVAPYIVERGRAENGIPVCRLVGPGGPLRWVPLSQRDALTGYAEQCNRAVVDGRDPAECRPGGES